MPPPSATSLPPVLLVCGEDDFTVKQRARQIHKDWCAQFGGSDHEIIDAAAGNSGEALAALGKLREALQTLPFFGTAKVIWFQNCTFLGDERAASTQAVTEFLAELAQELKQFPWQNVRLLITAGKVDRRKLFYKTIEKIGAVEMYSGWSIDDRHWTSEAEAMVRRLVQSFQKSISAEAISKLVAYVGPNPRQMASEIEKLLLYTGEQPEIGLADVDAVTTRNKLSRAFALGDALGARDLPRLLRTLDEDLWEMRTDSQKSEIGLLYGLISKIRVMIFLKEMLREGLIKPETDYTRFKAQLERIPAESLPEDKRFNPLAMNAYVLFKALDQARNYSRPELMGAMESLLECNQRLISSGLDAALVLQQALVKIVSAPQEARLT